MDSETFDPERIFNIRSDEEFVAAAMDLFRFQAKAVPPYAEYVRLLGVDPERVSSLEEIPFLPISFFKSREVYGARKEPEKIFTSSSTTGQTPARHYVADLKLYERAFTEAFEHFYGPVGEVSIFALLPGYLEREGSSLIYMVDHLIRQGAAAGFISTTEALLRDMEAAGGRRFCSESAMPCGIWRSSIRFRCPIRSSWRPAE